MYEKDTGFSLEEATLDIVFPGAFITLDDGSVLANSDISDIGETAVGRKMWIQTPKLPNKRKTGGLIRATDQYQSNSESMTAWGVVRQMGKDCYKDDVFTAGVFSGDYVTVGQIARIPRHSEIMRKETETSIYILVNDIHVISIVNDWKSLLMK